MDQAIKLWHLSASKNKQRHNNKHHSFSIETDVVTREKTQA